MTFGTSVEIRWVLVPIVVKKKVGYAQGLGSGHFELFVDGKRVQDPDFEKRQDAPVSAVFLQDLSGSIANGGKLAVSRRIFDCFLDLGRPGDRVSVATFGGGHLKVQVPPTADFHLLRKAPQGWEPWGTTALHDAVAWLPDLKAPEQGTKRVALLVTDGVDNASTLSPEEARELVRRAELPVYVLGLGTGSPYVLDPEGNKLYRFADVLNLLAHQTGGRYETFSPESRVRSLCRSIVDDLRHQYVLSFPTSNREKDRYRSIEVRVRGKSHKATYRRGYVGGPPA